MRWCMPPNVAVAIELSERERLQLEAWTRRRTSAQALALRSRIVLAAAEGLKNTEIAERLQINRAMAAKWRSRFAEQRLDGLTDEPRPGRPRTITDEQVDAVITTTLESTPKDATHWSTRSMAKQVGLTQTAVSRIWRAFGLQPHRQDSFTLYKDPLFVDKVHDPGARPHRAGPADAPRHARARHPRLPPRRHLQPLRRAGPHHRQSHRPPARPPPRDRVQAVSGHHRPRSPRRSRRPHRARQQLHPQDTGDPEVAARAPPLPAALHAHQRVLAQPRRALVRRTHQQAAQARHPPLGRRPQQRHPRLDRNLERRPQALRLDQDRRPDPRLHPPLLRPNQRLTTLEPLAQHPEHA